MRRSRRTLIRGALAAAALVLGATACAPEPPSGPTIVGSPCSPESSGVTVVVDYTALSDLIEVACAPGTQASGLAALSAAGFTTTPVDGFPTAVCTINGRPAAGYPTCWSTGDGYWSYWKSDGSAPWGFSDTGPGDGPVTAGSWEGWAWHPGYSGDAPRFPVS